MTEVLIIRSLDPDGPMNMSYLRFQVLLCIVAFASLHPSDASAWQSNDLLDPSLDRPLAQYKSTNATGFGNVTGGSRPATVNDAPVPPPGTVARPQQQTAPVPTAPVQAAPAQPRSVTSSGSGTELAPNPLANPGKITAPAGTGSVGSSPWNPEPPKPATSRPTTPRPTTEPAKKSVLQTRPQAQVRSTPKAAPKRSIRPSKDRATKKSQADKSKAKKKTPRVAHAPPELKYDIYRDRSVYPLDPRKPNNPCTRRPSCGCGHCGAQRKTGIHGLPYQPHEPGGYRCGKNCPNKRPEFSIYWPRPFSVRREDHGSRCKCRECCGGGKKINDLFDGLSNFRLIDYNRTDNGYCGPESDPYGCLGESKVAGVGFRSPGAPVAPSSAYPLR